VYAEKKALLDAAQQYQAEHDISLIESLQRHKPREDVSSGRKSSDVPR